MEDIGQGNPGGQDLKGQPPDRYLEVLNQWNIPGRDSPVEDIGQGIPGGQDMKGQPLDRHLTVFLYFKPTYKTRTQLWHML